LVEYGLEDEVFLVRQMFQRFLDPHDNLLRMLLVRLPELFVVLGMALYFPNTIPYLSYDKAFASHNSF